MSIQEISAKFKQFFEDTELFTSFILVVVALASFGLGRLSVVGHASPTQRPDELKPAAVAATTPKDATTYVGSKNGETYQFPWCPGALRVKDENKVVFQSKQEAEAAGYRPAANCKGM
jgi:hypothetical protein